MNNQQKNQFFQDLLEIYDSLKDITSLSLLSEQPASEVSNTQLLQLVQKINQIIPQSQIDGQNATQSLSSHQKQIEIKVQAGLAKFELKRITEDQRLKQIDQPSIQNVQDYRELSVAIIGGGLGGIAAALSLQMIGVKRVKVFERDAYFGDRKQGYGLTLTNNTKGALAKLGLLEQCITRDCPSNCHWIFTPSGKVLGYYGRQFKESSFENDGQTAKDEDSVFAGRGNLRVPRQDLRQMLLEKIKPNTLVWGKRLKDYHESKEGVKLLWEDGTYEDELFDVVVGADGIRSNVRQIRDQKLKLESSKLLYVGVSVILGISNADHPLIQQQGFYTIDGLHRLFTMPFREADGKNLKQTMWQLSFSDLSEEQAQIIKQMTPKQLLEEAHRRTYGWFAPVSELISATPLEEVWGTPLHDRDPMIIAKDKFQSSRVTVIGDACHPMSMFKGQGANQALEDGPLLAYWLTGGPSKFNNYLKGKSKHFAALSLGQLQSQQSQIKFGAPLSREALLVRLRCFEREMVSRTTPKVQASRKAALFLHSKAALQELYEFEGIGGGFNFVKRFLQILESRKVTAHDSANIVEKTKQGIQSLREQLSNFLLLINDLSHKLKLQTDEKLCQQSKLVSYFNNHSGILDLIEAYNLGEYLGRSYLIEKTLDAISSKQFAQAAKLILTYELINEFDCADLLIQLGDDQNLWDLAIRLLKKQPQHLTQTIKYFSTDQGHEFAQTIVKHFSLECDTKLNLNQKAVAVDQDKKSDVQL